MAELYTRQSPADDLEAVGPDNPVAVKLAAPLPVDASSARRLIAITKSDTTDLSVVGFVRSLYVGGLGDVAVLAYDDTVPQTFSAVPAGSILPIAARRVMSTGTTATLILGLL